MIRKLLTLLFIVSFLLVCPVLFGQEEDSLYYKTIEKDIRLAGYSELVEWCRTVGIAENGSIEELRKRLLAHFNAEEETVTEKKGDTFIIRSADKTRYFNIENNDENYITISGNIILEVNEEEKKISHEIQADKLIYNQKQQLMTADGNVIYSRKTGEKEEKYFGDKLTFNLEDWSGVFFNGISEKNIEMNQNEVTFFYSGERIFKSGKDVSVMENAVITSSEDPDNSYYRLKARKIWLMAPGEWGVRNAVLYVGNVPMFYFPFFFKPGDRFVMRPSIGYQEPRGHFLQTTTYFYGEPSGEEENLSFLAASDAEDRLYEKELNGLYLRRTDRLKENPDDTSYVKLLLDAYYNLGLYAALQGDISARGYVEDTDFYFGLARTRNVYNQGGLYTPFYEYEDGSHDDYWNRAYLGSHEIPFRFGLEFNTGFEFGFFKSDVSFNFYSDPFLLDLQENRSENMNWAKLLGMEDEVEENESYDFSGVRERLYWLIHTEMKPEIDFLEPYFNINVKKFDFYMNWKSKERDFTGIRGLDSGMNRYITSSASTDHFFPESHFYYPENYVLPDLSFTVSGTIFDRTYNGSDSRNNLKSEKEDKEKEEIEEDTDRQENKMKDPFEEERDKEPFEEDNHDTLIFPAMLSDIPITLYSDRNTFSHNFSYTISPNFIVDHRMEETNVKAPEEVDFERYYTIMRTYGEGKLSYEANVFDTLFSFNNDIIFKGEYRKHTDRSDTITDAEWDSFKNQDYTSSKYNIENDFIFKTMPLYMFDKISQSYISYRLDTILLKKEFTKIDENDDPIYNDYYFEWEKEFFKHNEGEVFLSYLSPWNQFQTSRVKTVFGPLNRELENENIFRTGLFTTSTFFRMMENDNNDITYEPFILKERLAYNDSYLQALMKYDMQHNYPSFFETEGKISFFEDELYLKQSYIYDINEGHHDEAITTLNIWYLNLMYKAEWMYPYYYEQGVGWLKEDEEDFVPSKLTAAFEFSKYGKPFWRNRIRYRTDISAGYNMDLQKFVDNALTVSFGFEANIYKLFNVSFKTVSENNATYRYSDNKSGKMGEERLNPFRDLWNSFCFWDKDKRYESSFKLKSLETKIVHHLGDWDLSYTYFGEPELETNGNIPEWKWISKFSIMVQWNPIPELRSQVRYDDEAQNKYSM